MVPLPMLFEILQALNTSLTKEKYHRDKKYPMVDRAIGEIGQGNVDDEFQPTGSDVFSFDPITDTVVSFAKKPPSEMDLYPVTNE